MRKAIVSIPLRYGFNPRVGCKLIFLEKVSIPLRYGFNTWGKIKKPLIGEVSIPLRYGFNKNDQASLNTNKHRFQYLLGTVSI